jgi:hypothetical protein
VRAADGRDGDRAATHSEGQHQSEDEVFHRRLPGQQPEEPGGQAATGGLLTAKTATAPPSTARASTKARASLFIEAPGLAAGAAACQGRRAADGGDGDGTADHGEGECQSKSELLQDVLPIRSRELRLVEYRARSVFCV